MLLEKELLPLAVEDGAFTQEFLKLFPLCTGVYRRFFYFTSLGYLSQCFFFN